MGSKSVHFILMSVGGDVKVVGKQARGGGGVEMSTMLNERPTEVSFGLGFFYLERK